MKVLGIYHRKDNDGFASAAVLKHWASQNSHELLLVGYDYSDSPIILYDAFRDFQPQKVYMIDVTFRGHNACENLVNFAEYCKDNRSSLTVIDHHEKSFKDFNVYLDSTFYELEQYAQIGWESIDLNFTYIFDNSIAACELAYKWLFKTGSVPKILEIIGKYDTFRIPQDSSFWLEYCLPFQMGSRLAASDDLIKWICNAIKFSDILDNSFILQEGKIIMAYEVQQLLRAEKTGFRIVSGEAFGRPNLKIGIINAMLDPSQFKPSGEYDAICVYYQADEKTWKYSFRSGIAKNDLDLTELVAVYGGGGHAKACGFTHHYNLFENPTVIL